jgi:hypothetical protein
MVVANADVMRLAMNLLACALATLFSAVPASAVPNTRQPFSVTLHAPNTPVKAGLELRLLVTVKNTSNRSITFSTSPGVTPDDSFDYEIDARDGQGHPAPPSAQIRIRDKHIPRGFGSAVGRTLQPGESFTDQVTVTTFYDLSQPGKYTISVARPFEPWQNLGKGSVKSNTITIAVTK